MNCTLGLNPLAPVPAKTSCDECYSLFTYGIHSSNKISVANNFISPFLDFPF